VMAIASITLCFKCESERFESLCKFGQAWHQPFGVACIEKNVEIQFQAAKLQNDKFMWVAIHGFRLPDQCTCAIMRIVGNIAQAITESEFWHRPSPLDAQMGARWEDYRLQG